MAYLTPAVCKGAEPGAEGGHPSQVRLPSCLAAALPFCDEVSFRLDCSMGVAGRRGKHSESSGSHHLWGLTGCLATFSMQRELAPDQWV